MNLEKLNARDAFSITPNDSANLARSAMALYVGSLGAVRVTTIAGTDVTFAGLPAGSYLNVQVVKVWATSTTAGSIVGLVP
jgi:hypothetical protein